MILLDTSVISELIRRNANDRVLAWAREQVPADLYLTSVTAAELLYGVARLPSGRRKSTLGDAIAGVLKHDFSGRILPFDLAAAPQYAVIATHCARQDREIDTADGQIAAICATHGATLATRNIKDFAGTGIQLIDPWSA